MKALFLGEKNKTNPPPQATPSPRPLTLEETTQTMRAVSGALEKGCGSEPGNRAALLACISDRFIASFHEKAGGKQEKKGAKKKKKRGGRKKKQHVNSCAGFSFCFLVLF